VLRSHDSSLEDEKGKGESVWRTLEPGSCKGGQHCVDRGSSVGKLYFGRGTQLTVWPDITDPKPSVYQLRNPKSSDTSICLFTDFNSEDKGNFRKEGVFFFNSTTLDMKVMNFKSNGMLAWSKTSDFTCNDTFNEIKFYSSSNYSCDAQLTEKGFETDMDLNLQNLSLIGFRILLLKVVGFNLFMTLRLWSS
uniref:T-cell receptor alpha chain constant domain-containing protein n=1 Tax=Equus asinus TaxID=9793 RepID=A0A9L0IGH2_EQUAS